MRYFCTYFDCHYLARALVLYDSLKRSCGEFQIWMLCMDEESYAELARLQLPEVNLLKLDELERDDAPLLQAKSNRSRLEYYFTCTPSLPRFILKRNSDVDLITYLDSDLYFFSNIEPLFDEISDRSIAIIAHRFSEAFRKWEWNGIYNVGWVTFRRDEFGMSCLEWWRERCLEWCYDRIENNRFADQKYLDDWPTRFQNVVVLQHKGANLAPWNVGNYKLTLRDGAIFVDDQPLIFFHFHAFKQLAGWIYDTQLAKYKVVPSNIVVRNIFAPYVREVISRSEELGPACSAALRSVRKNPSGLLSGFAKALKRQYLIVINGHII
jgi:hypothetical protein